ncbi:MAG: hypothetical protein ACK4UK_00785 [Flavobacterium sp.]
MKRKIVSIVLVSVFMLAFQCDNDPVSTKVFNHFKVSVTPQSVFSLNDTIWIEGIASSKAFDTALNDSIVVNDFRGDDLSIFKFITPNNVANCKDAIDQFELLVVMGSVSFLPICENGQMTIEAQLNNEETLFKYRLGLRATSVGDFVLSWTQGSVRNQQRNEFIAAAYPLSFHPDQIGMDLCGRVSWRYINESQREFYFKVE